MQEFKRDCMGIRLLPRRCGPNDNHVEVIPLVEDDEHWFEKDGFSSFWIDEMIEVLQAAKAWMENNCEPDITDGKQYGFKFKEPRP